MMQNKTFPTITDPFDIPDENRWIRSFSFKLDTLMRSKHISNSELESRIGLSRQAINRYRKGVSIPNAYTIVRLALGIGCTTDALLNMSDVYYQIEHESK